MVAEPATSECGHDACASPPEIRRLGHPQGLMAATVHAPLAATFVGQAQRRNGG